MPGWTLLSRSPPCCRRTCSLPRCWRSCSSSQTRALSCSSAWRSWATCSAAMLLGEGLLGVGALLAVELRYHKWTRYTAAGAQAGPRARAFAGMWLEPRRQCRARSEASTTLLWWGGGRVPGERRTCIPMPMHPPLGRRVLYPSSASQGGMHELRRRQNAPQHPPARIYKIEVCRWLLPYSGHLPPRIDVGGLPHIVKTGAAGCSGCW